MSPADPFSDVFGDRRGSDRSEDPEPWWRAPPVLALPNLASFLLEAVRHGDEVLVVGFGADRHWWYVESARIHNGLRCCSSWQTLTDEEGEMLLAAWPAARQVECNLWRGPLLDAEER